MPPKPPIRIPRAATPRAPAPQRAAPRTTRPQPTSQTSQPPHSPSPRSQPRAPYLPTRHDLVRASKLALLTFATALLIRDHVLTLDVVNGSSMAPTLSPYAHETGARDRIFIERHPAHRRAIQRGDVVTFWKPHRRGEISVKRVIALEGDVVYPRRGYAVDAATVQGARVEGGWDGLGVRDEDAIGGEEVQVGKVVVPRGHVWVEGDNWRKSFDSCDVGPVSLALVDGRAVGVWRGWFGVQGLEDGREEGKSSRIVEGGGMRADDGFWDM